jgi:intein/homing endonuclease
MKYQFGWAGPKEEEPALEAFAAQPDHPIVDTRMIDWDGLASAMQTDSDPKGKRFAFWDAVVKLTGKHLPNTNQLLGDCFVPSSQVRMADGTEKAIEDVVVGEEVLDHIGSPNKVIRVIKKPYSGDILKFEFRCKIKEINCTPDHRMYVYDDVKGGFEWVEARNLKPSCQLLQPKDRTQIDKWITEFDLVKDANCIPISDDRVTFGRSRNTCPRYIALDSDLAWMLGLFLADGSLERNRITFNLSDKKAIHAKRIEAYMNSLGIECKIYKRKSKPSVLYCRISNTPLSQLFNNWIKGNTYTKRIPAWVFLQAARYQYAVLEGWIDGDGHIDTKSIIRKNRKPSKNCKITGVSVNKNLISDFYRICNNLLIRPRISQRKPRKQSKIAYDLQFNGSEAVRLKPAISSEVSIDVLHADITSKGTLEEVTAITSSHYEGFVYCLEVEHNHSFQVDGLAVHNCVAAATEMGLEYLLADQIVRSGNLQQYRPVFRPWLYGAGRVLVGGNKIRGDGSLITWQYQALTDYGVLAEDEQGVPGYSTAIGREWGSSRSVLDKWKAKAAETKVEKYIEVKNFDDAAKAIIIAKAFPCIASGQGFQMQLRHDQEAGCSWFIPSGTWMHQMHLSGLDYNMKNPRIYVGNQWSYGAHPGQLDGPSGGGWVPAEFFDKWVRQSGCYCLAMIGFDAWRLVAPNFAMK